MDSLTSANLQAGRAWPMGVHFDGHGINVAVFSANALAIELCLFDDEGVHEVVRLRLPCRTGDVWHGYLPQAAPGLIYGLRAHGPWRPDKGHRFDSSKLLLDPCAREIVGDFIWSSEHFAPDRQHPRHLDTHDNARLALKARVVHDNFDWGNDKSPYTPLAQTVLYECHVKGFSKQHPDIPVELRGSLAGLGHPVAIKHFKQLGITALNLLPVHYAINEERLVNMGLTNYWGYNTLGFFCVDPRLASGAHGMSPRDEFRHMVRALHRVGIEVILDVVYNHTAEGDHNGPTLSFRGLDNASFYHLVANDPSRYENFSGCGNTVNVRHPKVLQLVMDSLRYWVSEMHVDGFRFDLASVLGRTDHGFSTHAAFFAAVAQDPVLSRVKLIAEPWDLGPGGYQVGGFPKGWLEWNDHFRDGMRRFWVQQAGSPHAEVPKCSRGDFAMRLCGSSDLYQVRQRAPVKSVNYVVSHDGFTLADLVSYNHRRNLANGEDNRDGTGDNLSFNCGEEGPTDNPEVLALRGRLQRAMLASTVLAQGTPMLSAGDEIGHSQNGNNNPYCQDNATTWIDWSKADTDLLTFTQRLIALRHQLLPFASQWYRGITDADGMDDLSWWQADGSVLQGGNWHQPMARSLICLIGKPGRNARPLAMLINANASPESFILPRGQWQAMLDTSHKHGLSYQTGSGGQALQLASHSLMLLQQISGKSSAVYPFESSMPAPLVNQTKFDQSI
jgi:glycogen operon protein